MSESHSESRLPEPNITAIKASAKKMFGENEGVEGIGIGENGLRVYVRDQAARTRIPTIYLGVPIECVVVGRIGAKSIAG